MKTDESNQQDEAQNASAVRDCPDSAGYRLWDGSYEKKWYDVRIPDTGEEIRCCWPNAGRMCNFMNDINQSWGAGEIEIRESDQHPLDLLSDNK